MEIVKYEFNLDDNFTPYNLKITHITSDAFKDEFKNFSKFAKETAQETDFSYRQKNGKVYSYSLINKTSKYGIISSIIN